MQNQFLKLQLDTPKTINQDLQVELVSEATGKKVTAKPYLDGSVSVRNLAPGAWRLKVLHPNMIFPVFDKPIRVLPDRPTFVPIRIPDSIFSNAEIRDIKDADLSPVQAKLVEQAELAEGLADKRAGDPIFAGDWNELATAVGAVGRATGDLATLVSPQGHDHPEIAEKIDEIQGNLQKFYDLFGKTLAGIQRQIQELALKQAVEDAIAADDPEDPKLTDSDKADLREIVGDLSSARRDKPRVYAHTKRRAGEKYGQKVAEVSSRSDALARSSAMALLAEAAQTMANLPVSDSYERELDSHDKVERKTGGGFTMAVQAAKKGL